MRPHKAAGRPGPAFPVRAVQPSGMEARSPAACSVRSSSRRYDTATETMTSLGEHEDAVRCVDVSRDLGAVVTGGWDGQVKIWDPRAPTALQHSITVPGKVYTMAMSPEGHNTFVVGTSERSILIFDTRSLPEPAQKRESSLKFQTRCLRMFPDGEGFAVSSIEGRVAIEFVDPDEATQKKKYAFKCHRAKVGDTEHVYPVNALAFHPTFGTFATGGCDGLVNIWDARAKKRLCRLPKLPVGVAAMDFNRDGSLLAIASSYTYEEGDKECVVLACALPRAVLVLTHLSRVADMVRIL